ncbi:hypothetical protein [Mesorhizobium sp. GbtcB19]|uniref:hypothetical protein n=1 Tax=Mesorhizobium sp. GbtcB19 TaxID=2824764 RepID=UPI001C30F872|nr:hypothetical protein [Mesorhizobium sp. GbtcB19]
MPIHRAVVVCICLWCFGPELALAEELRMFGHDVSILKNKDQTQDQLSVDGKVIHADEYISFDEVAIVDGTPAVIGESSPGGNACDASPFVLSFPPGKAPRLDGPLDSCATITSKVESDRIVFSSAATAADKGQSWIWTANGFADGPPTVFSPDRTKGWDDLRARKVGHPADLFNYGEVGDQINALLGQDRAEILPIMQGVGSVEYDGDYIVATSCLPHMCDAIAQITVADLRERKIYLAWKLENQKIVVRPPVGKWPQKARSALSSWARQWE